MTPAGAETLVRELLATVLERPQAALAALPAATALFGPALNLDSFTGMALLAAIQTRTGLDLAADDLALDSLETIASLAGYVAAHA